MKFALQRKWFESWYSRQFPKTIELLEKNKKHEYLDMNINMMFIGWCAAWEMK
jgi:hypothetical protein